MKLKNLTLLLSTICCTASPLSADLIRRWALNEIALTETTPPGGIVESVSGSTAAVLLGDSAGVVANPGVTTNDLAYLFQGNAANSGGNAVSTGLTDVLPATGDFSVFVTARFATNYQGGARLLFSNNNGQAGRIDFGINGDATVPNRLTFFIGGSPANTSVAFIDSTEAPTLFDGNWHEVGVTRSGTTLQLYVDGVAVGASGTSALAISTGTLYRIGRRSNFTGFFNNAISEVQVFSDVRTQGVPVLLNEPPSELTAYEQWALDSGMNPFGVNGAPTDDYDGDGSLNIEEFEAVTSVIINRDANGAITGTTPFAGSSDPTDPDSQPDDDQDGMPDGWELFHFTDLLEGKDDDFDEDGYSNWIEFLAGSDPANELSTPLDTDADGLPDAWEIQYFGNLSQGASGDFDGDGISNLDEYLATRGVRLVRNEESGAITAIEEFTGSSDPTNPDSQPDEDGDGLPDGWEIRYFGSLAQGPDDDFDADGFANLEELLAGSNPARTRNTPLNVGSTVKVAIATSVGIDEYTVENNNWSFVRQITAGETTSLVFHQGALYAASPGAIRRIDPATGTAVTLVSRNEGDALTVGWTTATARGMELGPDWKLYFATAFGGTNGQGVFRLNTDGSGFESFIPRNGDDYELSNAIDVAWKDANTLLVTSRGAFDATNRFIYQFDAGGAYTSTIANTLQGPQGLFVDGETLWVTGTNASTALISLDLTGTPPLTPQVVRTGAITNPDVVEILGELHVVAFGGSIRKDVFKPTLETVLASVGTGVNANDLVVFESSANPYDSWAAGFGIDPAAPGGGPADDFDGDGTRNGVEFALGLDPTDGTSRFAAVISGDPATGLTLAWPSAAGITFEIRSSIDLVDWSTLAATVTGQPGQSSASWTAPPAVPGERQFFRVQFNP